ncbi:MAG: neutral/alkaline non-lysosomal ceramidase N-terminal domain-containing protein [Chloroflexi bacterium]|nr:neutral/alkaline non-lysosomal ceramidase N-terminal domain-containing protein [Chloroflexota bacterium]
MFKASAAQVDLNPPTGSWMTGFAARIYPTTGVHDPIMARALLLDDGHTRLALVTCDVIGFTPAAVADLRHRIARKSSIPALNILISCTHTHSGPATMPFRGVMGIIDADWLAEAERRIVELVVSLPAALKPARFAHASARVGNIGYNRQDQAHAVDEELNVLAFDAVEGAPLATLVNYATHPVVLGPDNLLFSADYPGEVSRCLSERRGGIGLYLQGACGDIDPVVYRERGWGSGTFDDTRRIGETLVDAAVAALNDAAWSSEVALRVTSKMLEVPLDQPPTPQALQGLVAGFESDRQKAQASADVMREKVADAMLDWAHELEEALAAGTLQQVLPSELFVASINDVRLIAAPFEPYTDIGLQVKAALQPLRVLFAGYANGLYGYCPTAWAKDQGGYGPDDSCRWFPRMLTAVGYGAAELIVAESAELGK